VVQVGYLPSTPRPTDWHQNWRGLSRRGGHAKFQLDRFRGFRAPDGRISLSPIDLRHHPYNSYAPPCYTVMRVRKVQSDNWVLRSGSCNECGRCRRLYRCDTADNGGSRACRDEPCWIAHRPSCRTGEIELWSQLVARVYICKKTTVL